MSDHTPGPWRVSSHNERLMVASMATGSRDCSPHRDNSGDYCGGFAKKSLHNLRRSDRGTGSVKSGYILSARAMMLTQPQQRELRKIVEAGSDGARRSFGGNLRVRFRLNSMGLVEMKTRDLIWPSGTVTKVERWFPTNDGIVAFNNIKSDKI